MRKQIKKYFDLKGVSPVVRLLTISDFVLWGGYGLILPLFSVFIVEKVKGGNLEVVGIAATIYMITKSLGQIPFGYFIDKIKGESDDFYILYGGSFVFSIIPLFYIMADTAFKLYLVQFVYGLASAAVFPSWYALFTRHVDSHREGMEWSVYNTITDIGRGLTAITGGFLATKFGYNILFMMVSVLTFFGSGIILLTYSDLKLK